MNKIKIQELTSPGCTMCAAAKEFLEKDIKQQFPNVEVEYIEFLSEEGQEMARGHDIYLLPGIFVNGELFSFGGLDKNKLIEKLQAYSIKHNSNYE